MDIGPICAMASGEIAMRSPATGAVNWWDGTPVSLASMMRRDPSIRSAYVVAPPEARSAAEAALRWRRTLTGSVRAPTQTSSYPNITPTRLHIPEKPHWHLYLAPADWAYNMGFLTYIKDSVGSRTVMVWDTIDPHSKEAGKSV